MAERRKLIVVSNRGPVSYDVVDGARVARRGSGGLVSALRGLLSRHDVTWIASALSDEDRVVAEEGNTDAASCRVHLVAHDRDAYDRYYNVVANPLLWFLQHYLWDLPRAPSLDQSFDSAWAEGYVAVNRAFADAVLDELGREPDAAVWFHDYHLYLAPRFVRDAAPDARLAHFVHVPWPQPDYWRILPEYARVAIHDGLLANDVVGFHTERWRRSFLESARELCGVEADSRVTAHPVSVDAEEFDALARSEAVLEAERELTARRPERLVVRVDRSDPSKNVVRGFSAFGLYLDRHPEMHGRVVMLALLAPTRQEIAEYAEYRAEVERAAASVNEWFGTRDWTPVDLRIGDDFARSVAAYKQYDVLLVNAVYDGLNLVAKEAPLVNARDGVLVLSENAGAHEELAEWSLSVNPFDVGAQADAIHTALALPADERRRRIEAIRAHVRTHDVAAWLEAQLGDLDRAAHTTIRA